MEPRYIEAILHKVRSGKLSVDEAYSRLKTLPYQEMGFAKLDHHRTMRKGFPEVVYCPGKTIPHIQKIMKAASRNNHNVMATRATLAVFRAVKKTVKRAAYYPEARIISIRKSDPVEGRGAKGLKRTAAPVAVITAGTADIPVAEEAAVTAELLGRSVQRIYDVGVAGLHRLLANVKKFSSAQVIIVVAGMEGALPSVVAGLTDKPVIAVPTSVGYGANFGGMTALLSMMNSCAPGVSVVNIDNGFGAGCLASIITRDSSGPKS